MTGFYDPTRIEYLKQFYSEEQIERYCQGSSEKLRELYDFSQPRELDITELADVNDGISYLCDSPDGWVPVEQWRNKGIKQTFRIECDGGETITASDDHLFQKADGSWSFARDLLVGDTLLGSTGVTRVTKVIDAGQQTVFDLAIGHENHRYFTNGISSHNSGKSLVLQNLALNWAFAGHTVIYITLELSEDLVSLRLDSMVSGKSTKEVLRNVDEAALFIGMKGKTAGQIYIKKMPEGSTTTNDLRAFLKEFELQTGKKPDAIVVDYLDLMYPNNRRVDPSDLFVKDKFVSEELRALMHETNCFGATASQLNRQSIEAQGEFDHSHIAGGISKINTADNVMAIYAPNNVKERGEYHLIFLKTRSSSAVGQRITLKYDVDCMRITDPDAGTNTAHTERPLNREELRQEAKSKQAPPETTMPQIRNLMNNRPRSMGI